MSASSRVGRSLGSRSAAALGGDGGGRSRPRRAATGAGAPHVPRVVTTGRKTDQENPEFRGEISERIDPETGERYDVYSIGRGGARIERRLEVLEGASPSLAQVDALAFTVALPDGESVSWLIDEMRQFLPVDSIDLRRGRFGFKASALFGEGAGLFAWGGGSQRGRAYFSIQGKGCAMVDDWRGLQAWLEQHRAAIKRVDLAFDDFEGTTASIAWAIEQYRSGGFNAGGRTPKHSVHGDWLHGDAATAGRTLGIGARASGKYCRIYEKGKQLGDAESHWVRVEIEWRDQDRYIPYDVLTRPGQYFAGAYPCLGFLSAEQSRIRTIAKGALIAFDTAVRNGKQHVGKLVDLMLRVFGGDCGEVVMRLRREGTPARIAPYSYHVASRPERLDSAAPGSFASMFASA